MILSWEPSRSLFPFDSLFLSYCCWLSSFLSIQSSNESKAFKMYCAIAPWSLLCSCRFNSLACQRIYCVVMHRMKTLYMPLGLCVCVCFFGISFAFKHAAFVSHIAFNAAILRYKFIYGKRICPTRMPAFHFIYIIQNTQCNTTEAIAFPSIVLTLNYVCHENCFIAISSRKMQ